MTNLGEMGWILGIQITCNHKKGTLALSQEKFINEILEHYKMSNSHPISTLALPNKHLIKLSSSKVNAKSYQHALGSLIYPMLETQPDLGYAIATLGHHATNPGLDYQHALKHVFHYLRATSNQQLVFGQGASDGSMLFSYANADWASDINNHKSMSSYVFKLASATVSWSSKKLHTKILCLTSFDRSYQNLFP